MKTICYDIRIKYILKFLEVSYHFYTISKVRQSDKDAKSRPRLAHDLRVQKLVCYSLHNRTDCKHIHTMII